ncbi:MAG: ABC transporter substrate-binding protein [Planctomycetes bacterium]|nr:ABC transporter substrate-binding protein [Planctomycetota bacterium]
MKKTIIGLALVLLIGLAGACKKDDTNGGGNGGIGNGGTTQPTQIIPIKIGYVKTMIINAHLGIALKHTNILEKNSFKGEVTAYDSETQLLNDLNKGTIDVAFTVDFPGLMALGNGTPAHILCSFGSLGRAVLLIAPDSPVQYLKDLKGSKLKIGVPFNTSAHAHLLDWLNAERIIAEQDVFIQNIKETELKSELTGKAITGAVICDPEATQYNTYKRIADSRITSIVLISHNFYNTNKSKTASLLKSLKTACYYLTKNQVALNNEMAKKGNLSGSIIPAWASFNAIYLAGSPDKINIATINLLPLWNKTVQYLVGQKSINTPFAPGEKSTKEIQEESERKVTDAEIDLKDIKFTPE